MNNATVSDTEVSFAASLYEAFRRFKRRCCSFAIAGLSDQKIQAIGASRMDKRHAGHFQTSSGTATRSALLSGPPLPFGCEQSDALCEALQGMTTLVMKPNV